MEPKKKKTPSDYPQILFRLSSEDKKEIEDKVERILNHINSSLSSDDKKFHKKDVIVNALKRGLSEIEKEEGIGSNND